MMQNDVIPPQEHLPINDEIRSPLGAHIFEFCESELFPENLQNSEAASSSNCCYEEHSSSYPTPRTLSITMDHNNMYNTTVDDSNIPPPPPSSAAACSSPSNRNSNLASCMLLEDQTVDDISASIDFTLSPSFHDQPQQYNSNQEPLFNMSNQIQLLGDMAAAEGSLYAPHLYNPEPMVAPPPPVLGPPITKEDYNIRLRSSSSAACTLADPMIGSYISSSSVTAPFSFDSSWLLFTGGSGMLLGTDFSHQELESQGDNGGFFLPDSLARVFNCSSGDLQTLSSSESQHMLNGSPSTTLASEISSLEDPTFKVGKLSAEERKRKIHRYLKKKNERNFSKKIKYACRKTLADSRPRVRGRFAKNDELGELARNTGNNQDDDVDEDVNRMFRNSMPDHHHKAVKDEDSMDPSELFAHMSEVNSFKCNYPIQSWI
ncbi:hypothetical protein C2S51_013760 [Perilla frutescens var. frutescens]|nr:hypothetical protein C2S51_013760 [Perilla frutescens var. frutescens]